MLPNSPSHLAAIAQQLQQGVERCATLLEAHDKKNNSTDIGHAGCVDGQPQQQGGRQGGSGAHAQQQQQQTDDMDDDDDVTLADEDDDLGTDNIHDTAMADDATNQHTAVGDAVGLPITAAHPSSSSLHKHMSRAPPQAAIPPPPPESIPVQEMFHLDQLDEAMRQRGYM